MLQSQSGKRCIVSHVLTIAWWVEMDLNHQALRTVLQTASRAHRRAYPYLVPTAGYDPTTFRLSAECSTN